VYQFNELQLVESTSSDTLGSSDSSVAASAVENQSVITSDATTVNATDCVPCRDYNSQQSNVANFMVSFGQSKGRPSGSRRGLGDTSLSARVKGSPNTNAALTERGSLLSNEEDYPGKVSLSGEYSDLSVLLYGEGTAWWSPNGQSITYQISQKDNGQLLYVGTLCPGQSKDSSCDLMLTTGDYIFTVNKPMGSTNNSNSISWDFCSFHGGVGSELSFRVNSKSQCVPLGWMPSSGDAEVLFEGSLALYGMDSSMFSALDSQMIANAVGMLLTKAKTSKSGNGKNSAIVLSLVPSTSKSDQSKEYDLVKFRLTVSPGDFVQKGDVSEESMDLLRETLSNTLQESIADGTFVELLHTEGLKSVEGSILGSISGARMVALEHVSEETAWKVETEVDEVRDESKIIKSDAGSLTVTAYLVGVAGALAIGFMAMRKNGMLRRVMSLEASNKQDRTDSGLTDVDISLPEVDNNIRWGPESGKVIPSIVPMHSIHSLSLNEHSESGSLNRSPFLNSV